MALWQGQRQQDIPPEDDVSEYIQRNRKTTRKGEPFYVFRAAGSDYEIGLAKGRQMAADMEAVWEVFRPNMETWVSSAPDEPRRTCEWLRDNLEKIAPWMAEQLRGAADGSGVSIERVYLLNHYGVLWVANGIFCSSVALRETEAGPILGQNLDIGSDDNYFVEELRPSEGRATLSDGMAAMCWSPIGINAAGLAVGSSMLCSPTRQGAKPIPNGVPFHFLPRLVLRSCADVNEAVEYLKSLTPVIPPGGGYQLNLVDKAGNMAVVDKSEDRTVVRQCADGLNFTTNCSLDAEFESWRTGSQPTDADYLARAESIREHYAATNGDLTVEWLKGLLRGHEGPGRLCRHGEMEIGHGGYSRLSAVCYPRDLKMEITNGWPCVNEYQEFSLKSL